MGAAAQTAGIMKVTMAAAARSLAFMVDPPGMVGLVSLYILPDFEQFPSVQIFRSCSPAKRQQAATDEEISNIDEAGQNLNLNPTAALWLSSLNLLVRSRSLLNFAVVVPK